ncbi:MAG UNVERIFIED_CONTAM: hypothetical protein LVR18_01605 [Planctomycetaceae bacterium]
MLFPRRVLSASDALLRALPLRPALALLLITLPSATASDPPAIDRIFPPGGQRGTTVNLRIAGKVGDGEVRCISAFPNSPPFAFTLNEKRDAADLVIPTDAPVGVHWIRFANPAGGHRTAAVLCRHHSRSQRNRTQRPHR